MCRSPVNGDDEIILLDLILVRPKSVRGRGERSRRLRTDVDP